MARLMVESDDGAVRMVLTTVEAGTPGRAQGTYGRCTACTRTIHRWERDNAITAASAHVDKH